jgi:molybdenum cofactor cytidylyltransferase
VLAFSAAHPDRVCQPAREGHRRHPVVLPKAVFRELAASTTATLKAFLVAMPQELAVCEVDDPGLELDIDRPEDYDKAVELAAKRHTGR